MRWNELFTALEAEARDLERQNRDADIADRTRSAQAKTSWLSRCTAEVGVRVNGVGTVCGVPDTVTPTWILLRVDGPYDWVVSTVAVMTVSGLPREPALRNSPVDERLTWSHAWRVLSRDRSEVRVWCRDGSVVHGVPETVGRDYVELRAYDEARPSGRPAEVVPYAAIAAVRCPS